LDSGPEAIHMAHQPLLRSKLPTQAGSTDDPASAENKIVEATDAGRYLSDVAGKLAAHTQGAPAEPLALDLILHEIVEQARLATTANGAAIALVRDGELVCRATSGPSAPDLGTRLTTHSGLSGACVQTRQVQRCEDATMDSRVDADACRRLDIRSILIVPLFDGDTLIGIFAIFSARPQAFSERDVQTLQAFSARIVESTTQADRAGIGSHAGTALPQPLPASSMSPPETDQAIPRHRDYWTDVLSILIVALTLLLGWMLGRASWKNAFSARKPAATKLSPPNGPATPPPEAPSAAASATESPTPTQPAKNVPPTGGMVVYESGKVVFRMAPSAAGTAHTGTATAAAPPSLRVVSPEAADGMLVHRVEPQYPDEAKDARIQGEVVLLAVIGQDGAVRRITPVRGDSRLISAATDAVQQWRYKPYSENGQPVEMQTRITLKFALPENR